MQHKMFPLAATRGLVLFTSTSTPKYDLNCPHHYVVRDIQPHERLPEPTDSPKPQSQIKLLTTTVRLAPNSHSDVSPSTHPTSQRTPFSASLFQLYPALTSSHESSHTHYASPQPTAPIFPTTVIQTNHPPVPTRTTLHTMQQPNHPHREPH